MYYIKTAYTDKPVKLTGAYQAAKTLGAHFGDHGTERCLINLETGEIFTRWCARDMWLSFDNPAIMGLNAFIYRETGERMSAKHIYDAVKALFSQMNWCEESDKNRMYGPKGERL